MSAENPAVSEGGPTPPPSRLGDRYELGAVLGQGGMAVVRRGVDLRLGRTVAVKMLRGDLTESPAFQARFRREARAAAGLDHPAIVSVYDAGEDTVDGVTALYIVMEYVDGQTLRDLVRTGPQTPERALAITADILDALEDSHRSGIVHRDVKPANVMVTPAGAVKVMDFGVARAVADMSAALTQTSTVIGTAHYLSPEQARGDSVDARSDVYSTGCLLYELLTGRPPFQGDSAIAVAYQHVREPPRPPSAFEPSVPPEVDSIALAALAKRPDERYQSAAQMRSDILAVLAGKRAAMAPAPVETTAELQRTAGAAAPAAAVAQAPDAEADGADAGAGGRRRRRTILLAAAAVAVVLLALGGFAFTGLDGDPGRDPDARQGPARDAVSQTPTPQRGSGSLEPAGSSDVDPGARGGDQRPRRAGDAGEKQDKAGEENTGRTAEPGAGSLEAEPAPRSEPPAEPDPTSAPEQTTSEEPSPSPEPTPSESQPEDSPSPSPSPSEEPAPTTAPAPGGAGGP
jgi:hypothetical protein